MKQANADKIKNGLNYIVTVIAVVTALLVAPILQRLNHVESQVPNIKEQVSCVEKNIAEMNVRQLSLDKTIDKMADDIEYIRRTIERK